MASTYTGLGTELMATGENAGTWGTKTNTNLQISEQISGGYVEQAISSTTTTLSVSDGSAGATLAHRIIKFTGTLSANSTVTIPLDVQQLYVLLNGTSGSYTLTFKYVTGSGSTVVFGATDKGTKLVYATADDGTNPNMVDTGISTNTITGVTGDITIDSPADIVLDADGADVLLKDAGTQYGALTNSSGNLILKSGSTTALTFSGANVTGSGTFEATTITASTAFVPDASDGAALGTSSLEFSDLFLADGAVVNFGDDQDVSLTHVADTGLLLSSTDQLQFGDSGTYIHQSADGVLDLVSDTELELNATTIDINGNVEVSGSLTGAGTVQGTTITATTAFAPDAQDGAALGTSSLQFSDLFLADGGVISFGDDNEITLTHTADDGLILKHVGTGDGKEPSLTFQAGDNDIAADDVLGSIFFQAPDEGAGTDAILVAAGIEAVSEGDFSSSNNATKLSFKTGASEAATEKVTISSAGNLNLTASNTELRFYEGSNYIGFEAPALSGNQIWVLPDSDGSNGQVLKTDGSGNLSFAAQSVSSIAADDISVGDAAVTIGNGSTSADVTLDSGDDVVIDAAGGNVEFKDAGTLQLTLDMDGTSGEQIIQLGVDSDDLVFKQYDGTEVFRMEDGAYLNVSNTTASSSATTGSAIFGGGIGVAADAYVGDDAYLISDAAVLGFGADKDVTLTHVADTGLLLNAAMVIQFRDSGLTIGSNADGDLDIVSDGTAVDSINIESAGGITLDAGTAASGIIYEDDGTEMMRIHNSSSDVIVESKVNDKDIIFKVNDNNSSTEVARFDGDVSAFLMASGKEIRFADSGEKISGDGTDLTIASGGKINLNATSDVHIPNAVGIVFGGDSEKIEGDGTDLVISANNLTVDAAADIILDAGGNDFSFKSGGTEILKISNSSSDVVIKPIVDAKDIIFQQRDGTEVARIEDNATFNVVTDKLAINGTAVTSTAAELNKLDGVGTLAQAGKQTIWVPAEAMAPTTSNGCADITSVETTSGRPDMRVLDFDKDSDEAAQFSVAFPKSWDAGTITFQAYWSGTANTGGVSWALQGVAFADNNSIDTAYGTAIVVDDAEQGALEELNVTAESGAVTIAGSPGDNELVFFRFFRDVSDSNDNSSGDARLHGVKIFFTTDAANDA